MQVSLSVNVIISCHVSMTLGPALQCGLQDFEFTRIVRSSDMSCTLQLKLKLHQVWRNMPCVSQDNSLSAHTVHLVFLNINESLNYSAMSCCPFVGIYLSFCLSRLCDCYEFLSKTAVSELQRTSSVATMVKSQVQRAKQTV